MMPRQNASAYFMGVLYHALSVLSSIFIAFFGLIFIRVVYHSVGGHVKYFFNSLSLKGLRSPGGPPPKFFGGGGGI